MSHIPILFAVIIIFFSGKTHSAENDGIEKYRDFTPQQIADLPQELRSSEVPMVYIFAARSGISFGSELLFARQLNMLMYPAVSDYDESVRMFQTDLGDQATGVLTVSQIQELENRVAYQNNPSIYFPNTFSSYIGPYGLALAQGTWMIQGEENIAYPVNHSKITCNQSDNVCTVSQLSMQLPSSDDWAYSYHIHESTEETWNITSWSDSVIEAVPADASSENCRRTSLSLNFDTKEFYEITMNGATDCEVLGTTLPRLTSPRIAQLVDGEEIINDALGQIATEAFEYLSSGFKNRIEKAVSDFEAISQEATPSDQP